MQRRTHAGLPSMGAKQRTLRLDEHSNMTVEVAHRLMGDANGVKLRDSIDTPDGGSAWVVRDIPYTHDTKYGKRSDP